ncbi:MAG: chromate transporter [Chloroflexota bacterium]
MLIRVFLAFVQIGLFAFGGGYATIPLIQKIVVEELSWLSYREFLDLVAVSELTPGPIAVNTATYVGYRVAGVMGATFATIGVCLPSVILILIVIRVLNAFATNTVVKKFIRGLRPAVIALIAAAAISILRGKGIADIRGAIIALVAFLLIRSHKIDSIWVLVLAGVSGVIAYI